MTGFTYAQAAPGAFDMLNSLLIPTVLIIGIMYFLMIRPQQRRLKEHQAMIAAIRRGDTVVTSGGLIGKVRDIKEVESGGVKETRVTLETGTASVVVERSRIVRIGGTSAPGAPAA